MSNIVVLSQHLTNMIAAGEVVERPLQVVKELVENSIDANASNIEIALKTGGIESIVIKDDGIGMSYEDLPIAFMRHATSKLKDESQLFKIETMGFRGEALPSIASVAHVIVDSNNGDGGCRYEVDNGQVLSHQNIVCDKGTCIKVSNLFAKVPARLKHLKNDHYEQSLIVNTIQKMALIHPEIAFTLTADETIVFETDGKNNIFNVMYAIYGKDVTASLMEFKDESYDIKINGWMAASQYGRSNKNQITVSLNHRLIKPSKLILLIQKACKQYYPEGKYPILLLNIQMEYSLVDVNVHPSKLEVRISKENQLESMIFNALTNVLRSHNTYIDMQLDINRFSLDSNQPSLNTLDNSGAYKIEKTRLNFSEPMNYSSLKKNNDKNHELINEELKFQTTSNHDQMIQDIEVNKDFNYDLVSKNISPNIVETSSQSSLFASNLENKSPLTLIGQMHGKFILCADNDGLVIIDQHAAQERVHYEQIRQSMLNNSMKYPLLTPIMLELGHNNRYDLTIVNQKCEKLGLFFELFGSDQWLLREVPSWAKDIVDSQFYLDLIQDVLLDKTIDLEDVLKDKIAMKACKSSIKFNQYLDTVQQQQVINELFACCDPYACPHGRPIAIHISSKQLEKEFSR